MKRALIVLALTTSAFSQPAPIIDEITPSSGPAAGGTEVHIRGRNLRREVECLLPCPTTVRFGTITIPVEKETDSLISVTTPAHEIGVVDVTVDVPGKPPVTRVNGFTFTAGPEDSYERVLLPVHLDGVITGAFGAQWKTDLWMRNNGPNEVPIAPWPCPTGQGCPAVFPLTHSLPSEQSIHNLPPLGLPEDGNPSRLLYLAKPGADAVSFSLRFQDISRASIDGGVEMPVIREGELLQTPAQLFNVPLGPSFRVLLRVYELSYSTSEFRVTVFAQSELDVPPVHQSQVTTSTTFAGPFRPKAAYGHLDISALLNLEKVWPQTARIEIAPLTPGSRFWAVVSIANNDTQVVTLVTPQ